jgi:glycine betaine/proline transport system permease protein
MFRITKRQTTALALTLLSFLLVILIAPVIPTAAAPAEPTLPTTSPLHQTDQSQGETGWFATACDPETGGWTAYICNPSLVFEQSELDNRVSETIQNWMYTIQRSGKPIFDAIRWPFKQVLDGIEGFLLWIPWPVVVIAILAIPYLKSGWSGIGIAIAANIGLILVGYMGYWDATMTTLSMILTALVFCVIIGVPLGILAASSDTIDSIIRPVLDGMQTIHPFVYLIPIVMLFRTGNVSGTMATIIFALPPMVRLTNLGIRQVAGDVVEAGHAFGSNRWQLLKDAQLPLALPAIMAGLNQSLMLALSMVVIVALIGGGGLGEEIYGSVQTLQIGRATLSGGAVLVLAIILDRVSQVKGQSTSLT